MSKSPPPPNLNEVLGGIIDRFDQSRRLDRAHDVFRQALHQVMADRGCRPEMLRLLEVNLTGSLSGWMEFVLEERALGRNAVPDFARFLRRAFISHCREHKVDAATAITMAVELAGGIMGVAASVEKHLNLPAGSEDGDEL